MMNDFTLTWLGQGGYALRINDAQGIGGKTIYLDPYLSDMVEHSKENLKRLVPPPIAPQDARPDYYLATHDHMDHLDTEFIEQMDCGGVRFICPGSCKKALLALGKGIAEDQITVMNRGDTLCLGDFALRAVYADHTPDSVGFVITAEGITLYFTGDTLYGEEVGADANADVICCCINGRWGNMNAEKALRVALRSGAKLAIPNHYGMFAENTADPEDFCAPANAAGLKTYVMAHGEEAAIKDIIG